MASNSGLATQGGDGYIVSTVQGAVSVSQTIVKGKASQNQSRETANDLARRLQEGNESAFDEIFDLYQRKIYNLCFRMVQNREEASDLTQEVFVKVHRSISQFRGDSHFYTWLYTVAMNTCRNRLEKLKKLRSRERPMVTDENDNSLEDKLAFEKGQAPSPTARMEQAELRKLIEQAIATLPENFRSVILLKEIEHMSYEDIAKIMDCNLGTVKSRLNRARLQLREKLKPVLHHHLYRQNNEK